MSQCSCNIAANVGHNVLPGSQVALPYMPVKSSCFCLNDLPTRQIGPRLKKSWQINLPIHFFLMLLASKFAARLQYHRPPELEGTVNT